ncbi:P-loop containing nucleoside triphosphate hydrolase protein [Aulographum hederae CBS 113979]|uniref:RNA helicase n=1 Tax=Aulographum hederae CBS 113979 TaxID=1176131 RepID=A0A6G1GNU3_9PEZI|nr:P-loop containing nucleoside triphosphate hydrolase protein [Aulographum hederae CBS 113979]
MPKNAHPPRNNHAKKPASKAGPSKKPAEDEGSFIVFSNAPDKPKKSKDEPSNASGTSTPTGKSKGKETAPPAEDAPKKPDTRTLIGGASWTGKLPVNMLSEHCQKQKWAKPEYTMSKTPAGFISTVILKTTNPKTHELVTLPPFRLPNEMKELAAQDTAVEARHFAATYTLFRVCSMKNIHMMMPPNYRDLWKGQFADLKKEDVQDGKSWMYEADPFAAQREREEAMAQAKKRREEAAKRAEKENVGPSAPGMPGTQGRGGGGGSGANKMRGWNDVPTVEMGKVTRKRVEKLIRSATMWNPNGVKLDIHRRLAIEEEVTMLGFRRSHVEEAADICKDREEILQWLMIHVPEDDLPSWCLPENYTAGVSFASNNLKREATLKRLASGGYAAELCDEVLASCGEDEAKAAAVLQEGLLFGSVEDVLSNGLEAATMNDANGDSNSWVEEQEVLSSIYDERYSRPSEGVCRIQMQSARKTDKPTTVEIRKPPTGYPDTLPILNFEAKLPSYIRLSIVKKALLYAKDNFTGEPMIYNLVDWIEQNAASIIENPGRLAEVAPAASGSESTSMPRQRNTRNNRNRSLKPVNWQQGTEPSLRMLRDWQNKQNTPAQQRMMKGRQSLPAWDLQDDIVDAVRLHQVVIISGETGSGKSTQSVQFVLDDLIKRQLGEAANIICTQPRRISALGLADRVADERCSVVGDEVGFSIRGESKGRPGITKITFVTTGVLLRRLQTSGGKTDDVVASLKDVSHVVVDEVHERSLDTDFLLVLLRDVLKQRRDLKVILMSATLDADVFEQYFHSVGPVGRIEIKGRTYPVEDFYVDDVARMVGWNGMNLDDDFEENEFAQRGMAEALKSIGMRINYDLIAQAVRHIDMELGSKEGGILIFLPGTMEIDRTLRALQSMPNIYALPLHASLQSSEQKRVFPRAPAGKRKVIAATNVAETSITIEDIVAVIDTGRVKETSYDPQNNMVKLEEVWASRAACKQRRGRAGRVSAGKCYKLYTRNAETMKMKERPEPEIRRVPLEQLCLSVKAMGILDVPAFLSGALTPPDSMAVEGAVTMLRRMGALDGEDLTALGRHLSVIPADLRCGKLLVYGATFSCLEACLTIASILTVRSPFVSPQDKREESKEARLVFAANQGDLIGDLRAYEAWEDMRFSGGTSYREMRSWCEQNFLSQNTLNDISSNRAQYLSSLKEVGFLPHFYSSSSPNSQLYNRYTTNTPLLRALVAASFSPQTARIAFPTKKFASTISGTVEQDPEARTIKFFTQDNGRVFLHPSSSLFTASSFPSSTAFLSYFSLIATSKVFVRDVTPCNAYSLLLFGGSGVEVDTRGRGLVVDGWVRIRGWARVGVLVARIRGMLDEVLRRRVERPGEGWEEDVVGTEVVEVVRRLVELDGLDR